MSDELGYLEFPGRMIETVPFTGLMESLTAIGLLAAVGTEAREHFTKDDLINLLHQIHSESTKAVAFTGASADEVKAINRHMMKNMRSNY